MDAIIIFLVFIVLFIIMTSVRQINEYEKGILFEFGKFKRIMNSGWHILKDYFFHGYGCVRRVRHMLFSLSDGQQSDQRKLQ